MENAIEKVVIYRDSPNGILWADCIYSDGNKKKVDWGDVASRKSILKQLSSSTIIEDTRFQKKNTKEK